MTKKTVEFGKLPRHIAIIMDGNRRWAKQHHLPAAAGHRQVVEKRVEELIDHAGHLGIPYITFWCFSTENWRRPETEVKGIMSLFRLALKKYAQRMIDKGARLKVIGDMDKFDKDIREGIRKYVDKSKNNKTITVTFALNYGGRDEIVRAIKRMNSQIQDSRFKIQDLQPNTFNQFLDTEDTPEPDLIIRTGGEKRLSGFMLWQAEYSELHFTDTLMPDFGTEAFDKALEEYGKRQRRLGC